MSLNRRAFLKKALWSGAALTAGTAAYATWVEPAWVQVNRVRVAVRGLPRAFDGLTIAHLSDLHRSYAVSSAYLNRCIDLANALEPDLMVFTGDYLTYILDLRAVLEPAVISDRRKAPDYVRDVAACIGRARARHGVFACLGNHDRWFSAGTVADALRGAGATVLRDAHTVVNVHGEPLPIVGIDDPWGGWANTTRAFAGVEAPFVLALKHRPDFFEHWVRRGAHLILAGHTHGGQIRLPWVKPFIRSRYGRKYPHGLFHRDDVHLYVTRGVGVTPPSVRFNCPPEIALLRLETA